MANQEQLAILTQGVERWNQWRQEHPDIQPDFSRAILSEANLSKVDFRGANLSYAKLTRANLIKANLTRANLTKANLTGANLTGTSLSRADLTWATLAEADLSKVNLRKSNLTGADLTKANLNGADLGRANLTGANLTRANMTGCFVYAVSAWDVRLKNTIQSNLIITRPNQDTITVDNLEVAQFIYLLLNNKKIRDVIDNITSKVVLILGRFTPERKAILDALRDELRRQNYSPILFDFQKPANRDLTETVSTLAHLARFIIADLTEPSSIPKELEVIVPTLAVPVQPLLEGSTRPYAMFKDYWKYQWVLKVYRYNGLEELLASLKEYVIEPAERKAKELAKLKAEE